MKTSMKPLVKYKGKFPKKVKVGSTCFDITWDITSFDDCLGETWVDQQRIRMCPDLPLVTMQKVLMHEIIHACIGLFKLPFPKSYDDIDEHVASLLGDLITGVLQENPKIVDFLLQK